MMGSTYDSSMYETRTSGYCQESTHLGQLNGDTERYQNDSMHHQSNMPNPPPEQNAYVSYSRNYDTSVSQNSEGSQPNGPPHNPHQSRSTTLERINTVDGRDGDASSLSVAPPEETPIKDSDDKIWKNFKRLIAQGIEHTTKDSEEAEKPSIPWMTESEVEKLMRDTIPEVRRCNFEDFKNRFSPTVQLHAVEMLVDSVNQEADMTDEQLKRLSEDIKKDYTRVPRKSRHRKPNKKPEHTIRIERLRINSAYILHYLAKFSDQPINSVPHTFLKPFDFLTHFHEQMDHENDSLARKLARGDARFERSPVEAVQPGIPRTDDILGGPKLKRTATMAGMPTPVFSDEDGMDIKKASEDMNTYMEAMKPIMTWYEFFKDKTHLNPPKIHFDDLPALFRMGEIVYRPVKRKLKGKGLPITRSEPETAGETLHRVYSLHFESPNFVIHDLEEEDGDLREDREGDGSTAEVSCYHLDSDGNEYRATAVRFAPNGEQVLKEFSERGRMFRDLLTVRHKPLRLNGWTLTTDPFGQDLEVDKHPRYIESDAIIDFAEAYQTYPWWKPDFINGSSTVEANAEFDSDMFPLLFWEDKDRSAAMSKLVENVFDHASAVSRVRFLEYAKLDKFVINPEERADSGPLLELTAEDLALLPNRIFCYALRERKFVNVRVESLLYIQRASDPFRDIQINPDHKLVIRAVLDQHFKTKEMIREAERQKKPIATQQDIIQGKGRGLVLLLHGAPGVGKTATAEAIAQELEKPLLFITSGDMGLQPEDVEHNLTHIFRLADRWDCVLLLDEADIFLSAREKKDSSLQRNALVSVFLRTLEYYPGVLFLTTNRPGVMDEAVKSRVHMIFKYPALALDQTMEVFRLNIRMLRQSEKDRADLLGVDMMEIREPEIIQFADRHFYEKPKQRWNGRQIRNAFQIARSLAHFEFEHAKKIGARNPTLSIGVSNFKKVADATMAFDEYRQLTIGKSDEEDAASRMERAREREPAIHRTDTASSWRMNYGDGAYMPGRRTPQPSGSYGHQYPNSGPPPQTTPSPNPAFALGGGAHGMGMTPNPYAQDRTSTPSYVQPQPQYQYQQQLPLRQPLPTAYSGSPGVIQDYKQAPLPPTSAPPPGPAPQPYVTNSLPAEQLRAPVPVSMDRAYTGTPPVLDQQRQSLSGSVVAPPPQSYAEQVDTDQQYGDETQRYTGLGYSVPLDR